MASLYNDKIAFVHVPKTGDPWAREVSRSIVLGDEMWDGSLAYFDVGEEALRLIKQVVECPGRILDLPCGHGRVLRWMRAEWPEAQITACDLNRDGVDFCASEFGASPLYSEVEPERIQLEGTYDLIWCGSLLTHLDAPTWGRFLRVFAEHLDGTLIFTTAGEHVAELMRAGDMADQCDADSLLAAYDATGFGYADYHGQSYGLARARPTWVRGVLEDACLKVVRFEAVGWGHRQDVWHVTREPSSPR